MKKLMIALFCGAISTLAGSAFAGGNAANGAELAKKYNCAACHGADYNKPLAPDYPRLAGQHADYLAHALTAYKRGDAPNGRSNAIMGPMAKPLSTKDIADLAAYFQSLPSSLVLQR